MTLLEKFHKFHPPDSKVAATGDVANNDGDAGAPVKIGGVAKAAGAVPAAVDDGDRVNALLDEYGRQRVILDAMPGPTVSATFTTTANSTTQGLGIPISKFGLQVKRTGVVTSWTVNIDGSIDGSNFFTLVSHTNVTPADGGIIWTVDKPVLYWRLACSAIVLGGGTNVVARAIAMQ